MPELIDRFLRFLDASPTPHHAVASVAEVLDEHGFLRVDPGEAPPPLPAGTRGYVVARGGSLIAFHVGSESAETAGFRVVAAHTDSPNLRVKPSPVMRSHGYVRLGVELYGGVLQATWADRDLGIAGQVVCRDGQGGLRKALVRLEDPICRIPNLAIHLQREVNTKGLVLNAQTQLPPVLSLEAPDSSGSDPLRALLSAALDVAPDDVLTWDLSLFDLTPARRVGLDGCFVASARLDNLASCHAGLEGLLSAEETPRCTSVLALFDHEEIGSTTSRGADSRTLESTLARLTGGSLDRALEHTWLVSSDMAHAVHPAHADLHDASPHAEAQCRTRREAEREPAVRH
jgi:aspartyl aminopeptidase